MSIDAPRLLLADSDATDALAHVLADAQPARAIVHLDGDLGAGKSSLARAWLRRLGVTGAVRSPTYTLVERYPLAGGEALHLDLYRIGDAGELEFLGLDDSDASLWLVEWPDRGHGALPASDLRIELAVAGAGRSARLLSQSQIGQAWLARMVDSGQLRPFPESSP